MIRVVFCILALCGPVSAETVIATRTIRPQQIVTAIDVRLDQTTVAGAYSKIESVIGQEARVAIYAGRAVMQGSVGEPAVVSRNQIVELIYKDGTLRIVTEGRALGRGGPGERIRVMNIGSRAVLFGTVAPDGTVLVTP